MWTSSDATGSPTMRSARTGRASARLRDLRELQPVLTTTRSSTTRPSVRTSTSTPSIPHGRREKPSGPRERDDPIVLGGGGADDPDHRRGRDRDPAALGRGDHERLALHGAQPTSRAC